MTLSKIKWAFINLKHIFQNISIFHHIPCSSLKNVLAESLFSPASMAVVNEIMYVIGGNIYHENDDVEHRPVPVELFDPKKEAWEMLDIKSDGITLRSVCVLDNKVVTTVVLFSCTCCNSF